MFPTIQLHLTCRKDRIHNRLQEKKNEDLFRRTSDDISKTKNNMTNPMTSMMHNFPAMKNSTLEELLIHLSFWIRNNAIMNE